jgi:hypothetical protein
MAWTNFTGTTEEVIEYLEKNEIDVKDIVSITQDIVGHWHVFHNQEE